MNIEDLEIDPQLFIKCRLCITQSGKYQIVPEVQEKIKYCFDIEIKPYDGLSQVICKTCSETVNNYWSVKKSFTENQQGLKLQKELKKEKPKLAQDTATTEEPSSSLEAPIVDIAKVRKKRNRIISSSSSSIGDSNDYDTSSIPVLSLRRQSGSWIQSKEIDNDGKEEPEPKRRRSHLSSENSVISKDQEEPKRIRSHLSPVNSIINNNQPKKIRLTSLKNQYCKKFVCRFCKKLFKNKPKLIKHLKSHKELFNKYRNIFQKTCCVILKRYDKKPNFTDTDTYVVFNSNLIIKDIGKVSYHEVWNSKDGSHNGATETVTEDNPYVRDPIPKPSYINKERSLSRLSTETLVYGNDIDLDIQDTKKEVSDNEVIDIDDSSNDSHRENEQTNLNIDKKTKSVQNIVSMCLNRHLKKIDAIGQNTNKLDETQLKSKVLNFGRKVINKQGLSCTLLLRYLEHKNLDVKWSTGDQASKEGNDYVRVMTRVKVSKDDVENANIGWKTVSSEVQDNIDDGIEKTEASIHVYQAQNENKIEKTNTKVRTSQKENKSETTEAFGNQSHKEIKNEKTNIKANQSQKDSKTETSGNQSHKEIKNEKTNIKANQSQKDSKTETSKSFVNKLQKENQSKTSKANVNQLQKENQSETSDANVNQLQKEAQNETSKDNVNQLQNESQSETTKANVIQLQNENQSETTKANVNQLQKENESEKAKQTDLLKIKDKPVQLSMTKTIESQLSKMDDVIFPPAIPQESIEYNGIEIEAPAMSKANLEMGCLRKLLNETPVANPRQLGKRPNETKLVPSIRPPAQIPSVESLLADKVLAAEDNLHMPIIAFTQSLATDETEVRNKNSSAAAADTVITEKPPPRIKVKPPSELMSERVLNNMSNQQSYSDGIPVVTQAEPTAIAVQTSSLENIVPGFSNINGGNNNPSVLHETHASQKSSKKFILDTPELPNVVGSSPFLYVQNLLQLHGIVLRAKKPSMHYNCLIRFKSKFDRPNTAPILVSLALYCCVKEFCLQINLSSGEEVNINDLPPHWQWEILKILRADVASKILSNSVKVGLHDVTYRFISLLKTINVVHC